MIPTAILPTAILPTAPPAPVLLPLVVFKDVTYCDSRHEHEITLISDGQRSYAHGDATDCGPALRYDATLTVDCGQPGIDDEPCAGQVMFHLDTAGTWTADPKARKLLFLHGQPVQR